MSFPVKIRINYFRLMACFHESQVLQLILAWIEGNTRRGVSRGGHHKWGEGRGYRGGSQWARGEGEWEKGRDYSEEL